MSHSSSSAKETKVLGPRTAQPVENGALLTWRILVQISNTAPQIVVKLREYRRGSRASALIGLKRGTCCLGLQWEPDSLEKLLWGPGY